MFVRSQHTPLPCRVPEMTLQEAARPFFSLILVVTLAAGCSSSDDDSPASTDDTNVAGDTGDGDNGNEGDDGNTVEEPDELPGGGVAGESDTDIVPDPSMVFFLSSSGPGDGGNLGGLAGADVHCATLAEAAGVTNREWRAYLSTTGDDGINAIDRIGEGPWFNANGVEVASSTENLLSDDNNLNKETAISELGQVINGLGDDPNRHDILTGTELDGLASSGTEDTTCGNWTSNDEGSAIVGHHDRDGGGANPMSWSTAHGSNGCSQSDLQSTGGDGLFYCFAIN